MISIRKTLICIIFAVSLISACSSNLWLHQNLSSEQIRTKSIAVIEPEIEFFIKLRLKEKPKPEYNVEVSKNVQDAIVNVLNKAGVDVLPPVLIDSLLAQNQDISAKLSHAKQSFLKTFDAIGRTQGEDKFLLNTDFIEFAKQARADYLIFVKGVAYQRPRTARNIILKMNKIGYSNSQLNGLFLEVGVVDVKTGEIVWFNRNHEIESDCDPLHFKSVETLCGSILHQLIN